MKSAILAIGTELLFGQVANTNAAYLSQHVNELGIDVLYHHTVGDNPKRMKEAMDLLLRECDLIVTTGGLGPTQDDLTKEIAAEYMGEEMALNNEALERIEKTFSRLGRIMTDNNIKQAYLPRRAHVFQNDAGTAPGFAIEKNGKIIICLPGPPREMKCMFENQVRAYLQDKTAYVIYSRMLRVFGIGESLLETKLEDLISVQTDPTIAPYAKEGEVLVRVTSKQKSREAAERSVADMVEKINERIGEYIYSYDDEDLADVVAKKLMKNNISISCAESCTGGMFAAALTGCAGISAVFDRGIVTYSNAAKHEELGVSEETLQTFGAVSIEAAMEMAEGLQAKTGSRLCISVTGVAGPGGGSEEKPVGLVYVAALFDGVKVCKEYRMRAVSRNWNRSYTTLHMLSLINQLIDGKADRKS